MSQPQPGMMVTPSVRLERLLGGGGMGSVWLAEHLGLKCQVVVKFIAENAMDGDAVHRFSREAAAAAQVKSPHVVQTLDHGVTPDNVPYIVLEYLEGHDLDEQLHADGPLSPGSVAVILTQLSRALEKAHARGIIHRDIKPANVFLCDSAEGEVFVKLLDFGIAKGVDISTGTSTRTGAAMGTPLYMSPEQLLGKKTVDHRADLWSLGVLAFEALTGSPPFDAETVGALTVRIMNEPPPKLSSVMPELGDRFDAWFDRACAREPEDRFPSAREMAEAFAVIAGVAAAPTVSIVPSGRKSTREVDPLGDTREHRSTGNAGSMATSAPHATAPSKSRVPVFAVVALVLLGGLGAGWLKFGRATATTTSKDQSGLADVAAAAPSAPPSVTPLTSAPSLPVATPASASTTLAPIPSATPLPSAKAVAPKAPPPKPSHDPPPQTTPSAPPKSNDIF